MSRALIISNAPGPWSLPPEVMTLTAPSVDTNAEGWDTMRETLWVPYSPYFTAGERRDHVLLPALNAAVMVVQNERVVGIKAGLPVIELTSMGLAQEKPWKCVTTADTQGTVGAGGVTRNLPTVTCYWFSETLEGTKLYIPWPAVPPETFGWQAKALQSGIANPNGWIIVKRDVDPLPVICGATAGPWKDATMNGGNSRSDANAAPQPRLCSVVDYYVYDFINTTPPND